MELTGLSRRELIASFLGTAVASAACHRGPPPVSALPGALVDHQLELGHLLRGPALPRAPGPPEQVQALIVGAGMAGLSAGWRLRAAGVTDFRVLELDATFGGTSQSGHSPVTAFPWGAHYVPAPLRKEGPLGRLLAELGALTGVDDEGRAAYAEEMLVGDPDERLFYRGAWYPELYLRAGASAADVSELTRFEATMAAFARARDGKGRKAFAVPATTSSPDAEWAQYDRMSFADWFTQSGFRSPRLKWVIDYACRDDYGMRSEHTSAWAGIWYFAARQEGAGTRNAGYLAWPAGNGHVAKHLADAVGRERLGTEWLVHTIEPLKKGALVHAWHGPSRTPKSFRAEHVVFAGPRFVAAHVFEPWKKAPPDFLRAFEYGPWAVANLHLKAAPISRGSPLAWDNVFYESQSLGYVVATHQAPRVRDDGPTVLTWYFPLTGADARAERTRLLETKYPEWRTLVLADLLPSHPNLSTVAERLDVMRWGHAMIRPRPGFQFSQARQAAAQSVGDVHFAHTDLSGMALVEEANWHGVRAAEAVLHGLGRESPSWLS